MSTMIQICIGISFILIIFTYLLNKKSYDFEKLSQYECGIEPFEEHLNNISKDETREKFYLKFYIIGIIFLIFDLESILLYPIILSPSLNYIQTTNIEINFVGYLIFLIFIIMLVLGLIYEYKKKVLN